MAAYESVEFLEQRISKLESLVFGNSEKDADYPKCIESLLEVQSKLGTALSGKKRAAALYEKLPELKKYLDHAYTDEMMLSTDSRAEIVLAEADFLEKQAVLWEKLSLSQEHINSEHIQAVPKLADKLQALSQIQIEQQDEVANLTEETRSLLNTYNNIVTLLSKQFFLWDQTLTELEIQSQKKH
ncbi:dynactin subunit 3-like isoform X2 [Physella acuta]|uniref:dynactin subunit 3-like isoform X2 n=1 Tax=Physella acuta TaxID=109671 RepID=UPI0027DC5DB5|nr:dynactin subunit 3-like isoform X2 [Physella acuta]